MTPAPSLAQLHDIHLPAPVGLWPPAPGWWLLTLLLVAALGAAGGWWWRRWQRQRYRRQALQLLHHYRQRFQAEQNPQALLAALSELLRRTALTAYPQQPLAALSGDAWRAFLRRCSDLAEFDGPAGDALINGPYRPQAIDAGEIEDALTLTEHWIRQHRRAPC